MTATNYIWDFATDSYLMEKDDSGNTTAVYTNEPVQYGMLISQRRDGTTYFHHYDAQGSTRTVTGQSQNVVETATYSAFGDTNDKTSAVTNRFGFTGVLGYYANSLSNDLYVRARLYQPAIARWLSRDPSGFVDGDVHLYRYVHNSPISNVDPSGFASITCKCSASCRRGARLSRMVTAACMDGAFRKCCSSACQSIGATGAPFFCAPEDWRFSGEWSIVGAKPDVIPPLDPCAGDWLNGDWLTCTACCIEYGYIPAAVGGTAGMIGRRVPKGHVQEGQYPDTSWLYPLRRCLPPRIRPKIHRVRTIAKWSGRIFIFIGVVEAIWGSACAVYCASRE